MANSQRKQFSKVIGEKPSFLHICLWGSLAMRAAEHSSNWRGETSGGGEWYLILNRLHTHASFFLLYWDLVMFSPDSEFSFQRALPFPHSPHWSQTSKINKDIILQTAANKKLPGEFQSWKPEAKHTVTKQESAFSYHQIPPDRISLWRQEMRRLYRSLAPSRKAACVDITAAFSRVVLRHEKGRKGMNMHHKHSGEARMTIVHNSCCFPLSFFFLVTWLR